MLVSRLKTPKRNWSSLSVHHQLTRFRNKRRWLSSRPNLHLQVRAAPFTFTATRFRFVLGLNTEIGNHEIDILGLVNCVIFDATYLTKTKLKLKLEFRHSFSPPFIVIDSQFLARFWRRVNCKRRLAHNWICNRFGFGMKTGIGRINSQPEFL